jgi:hypothetical protein
MFGRFDGMLDEFRLQMVWKKQRKPNILYNIYFAAHVFLLGILIVERILKDCWNRI